MPFRLVLLLVVVRGVVRVLEATRLFRHIAIYYYSCVALAGAKFDVLQGCVHELACSVGVGLLGRTLGI